MREALWDINPLHFPICHPLVMDHEPDVHRRDNENGVSEGPFEDVIQIHDNEDPCE